MTDSFDPAPHLARLKDFQRAGAHHAFHRLFQADDSTRRFLVADETGLGKTLVAKGIIALAIEHLENEDAIERIDIVYVCSNADIAAQNIGKLNLAGRAGRHLATRLTLLATQPELLTPQRSLGTKPVNFVSFTPGTSFSANRSWGQAHERSLLCILLDDLLRPTRRDRTALQRILTGQVTDRDRFEWIVRADRERWSALDSRIVEGFRREVEESGLVDRVRELIASQVGRKKLGEDHDAAQRLVKELRDRLALVGVQALQPDLIILDEFQRFRTLLDPEKGGDAAELADQLFSQPDARTLLLSATPYKPYTLAQERDSGEDHYEDFLTTLRFLAGDNPEVIEDVRVDLRDVRSRAIAGEAAGEARNRLEHRLRRLLSRTERPTGSAEMISHRTTRADTIAVDDIHGYIALHDIGQQVDAPLNLDYWKSAPYFVNFLDGYKVGEKFKKHMRQGADQKQLLRIVARSQRLSRHRIREFEPVDWGNARLRELAAQTVDQDWHQLLWMPPSLPYHQGSEPFRSKREAGITKRLLFSSWLAAPTSIASLLSYEVDRRIWSGGATAYKNSPEDRRRVSSRFSWRTEQGSAASMTTLAMFLPLPGVATATDPLTIARQSPDTLLTQQAVLDAATEAVRGLGIADGSSRTSASGIWYWGAALQAERRTRTFLASADLPKQAQFFVGGALEDDEDDETSASPALLAHLEEAQQVLGGQKIDADIPDDLAEVIALIGLASPANIAWRALDRLRADTDQITDLGHWQAAASLAAGLRNLFNRPDSILLLQNLLGKDESDPESSAPAHWRAVLLYCLAGDLQAVLDEHVHCAADIAGVTVSDDESLMEVAQFVRNSLSLRAATYRAFDPEHVADPDTPDDIPFPSRFAVRFGNKSESEDDARLPELRAAFNSPFWPFVLASTSIGQEGVDFHLWCHAVVHWNTPANPVDFEQREGRVNRYKGHAIRRNVAAAHRSDALRSTDRDPWAAVFDAASRQPHPELGDLHPFWVFPGEAKIERHLLALPLSRDEARWDDLQRTLALYRLAYGQPRQEDLIALLEKEGVAHDPQRMDELRLDLSPPPWQSQGVPTGL